MIQEIEFAPDSPLEQAGFELSVPPERKAFPTALSPRAERHAQNHFGLGLNCLIRRIMYLTLET